MRQEQRPRVRLRFRGGAARAALRAQGSAPGEPTPGSLRSPCFFIGSEVERPARKRLSEGSRAAFFAGNFPTVHAAAAAFPRRPGNSPILLRRREIPGALSAGACRSFARDSPRRPENSRRSRPAQIALLFGNGGDMIKKSKRMLRRTDLTLRKGGDAHQYSRSSEAVPAAGARVREKG